VLALGEVRVEPRVSAGRPARGPWRWRPAGVVTGYRGSDPSEWRTGVKLYWRVRLRDSAPGVDLVLRRGSADRFAYGLVLRPGVDARGLARNANPVTQCQVPPDA
jgi:hypothetical protein